jgi:hypothetical protein
MEEVFAELALVAVSGLAYYLNERDSEHTIYPENEKPLEFPHSASPIIDHVNILAKKISPVISQMQTPDDDIPVPPPPPPPRPPKEERFSREVCACYCLEYVSDEE